MDAEGGEVRQLEAEFQPARMEFSRKVGQMTSLDMMVPTGIRKRFVSQLNSFLCP